MEYTVYHSHSFPLCACMYMYTSCRYDNMHFCHRLLNFYSQILLHNHYSNNFNFSAVVILGFWLCQFNTSVLDLGYVCHLRISFLFGCLILYM